MNINPLMPNERKKDEVELKYNKKKRKMLEIYNKYEQYKLIAPFPDLLSIEDVTSEDPVLLNMIKGIPNSVPVPEFWKRKKKKFKCKRKPYKIPQCIQETGISLLRESLGEEDNSNRKLYPKMAALNVDNQKLYDCFFSERITPFLTKLGTVLVDQMLIRPPGAISQELREALGIKKRESPPWIDKMRKFGPPIGYPGFKMPGVNCNIINDAENDISKNIPEKTKKVVEIYDSNVSTEDQNYEIKMSDCGLKDEPMEIKEEKEMFVFKKKDVSKRRKFKF
ncbi:Pre-mRNA-splicing factor [Astathelohania contejeani]|uniref:Pre-mRNA-splicing factor n=1 Tax=Astathelohania contejeani TaxID=164912 RepID=A0ABQ7HZV8_9MICR|nr:Pre-mRNA-splicing factor [Thelohania contejeani]